MPETNLSPRAIALHRWACMRHGLPTATTPFELAAGDASFRRYFRMTLPDGGTRILMDAPPPQEDSRPFATIAEHWGKAGLPVPTLYATDFEQGFLELEDLGDTPLTQYLSDADATRQGFDMALALLDRLQAQAPSSGLPHYDADLLGRELDLFPEWCLGRLLGISPPHDWNDLRQRLIDDALSQPRVAVHRDFDAMNLMVHDERLYLIDFQDAVAGPLTYDLVSLLRGRYQRLAIDDFAAWVEAFRQRAVASGRLEDDMDSIRFRYLCDGMAAQRSLKVLGIFCRLTLRDARSGYLERLPRFLGHLEDSLEPHAELHDLREWLRTHFAPALADALRRRGLEDAIAP